MIRTAKPSDFEAIQALNREIFDHEVEYAEPDVNVNYPFEKLGIDYFHKLCNQIGTCIAFVYEEDGKVVGYAGLSTHSTEQKAHRLGVKAVQLDTLSVYKPYRDKGIGAALVQASKNYAAELGANRLRVCAYANNESARAFYQKQGFRAFEIVHEMEV